MDLKYLPILAFLVLLCGSAFAQNADITIEFLKPDEGITFKKGQTVEIEAKVTFPSGSTDQKVEALMATDPGVGNKLDLTKNAAGNYVGEVQITYEMSSGFRVKVFASANTLEGSINEDKEIIIMVEPTTISADFDLIPAPPYYLGTVIEKIRIDAFYSDGERVSIQSLGKPTLRIDRNRMRLELEEDENGAAIAALNYKIELNENLLMGGDNALEFELLDLSMNGGMMQSVEKRFEISDSHEALKLRIKNPPSNERLFHNMDVVFEIELTKGVNAKNERVFLTDDRDLSNVRECQKAGEQDGKLKFQCLEKTPSMEETFRVTYAALATAEIDGREITVYKISQNEVSNIVHVELEFPPTRESLSIDKVENLLKVNFYYAMNAKLSGGAYSGTVNGKPVEFVWDADDKAYAAEFDLKSLGEGQHEFEFSIEGLELENDTVEVNFVPAGMFAGFGPGNGFDGPEPIVMIGTIIAIFAAFTFVVWFLVLRKKREETIGELKDEAARLRELLKRIEIDYYKRRLDEAEYKKRALEYQTLLDETLAKIKVKEQKSEKK